MDKEIFFDRLSNYHPISAGLKAYLAVVLKEQLLPEGKVSSITSFSQQSLLFLQRGNLRFFSLDTEERRELTMRFFPEGQFLIPSNYLNALLELPSFLHAIDEVSILCFDQRHLYNLYRNFREFSIIMQLLQGSEIQEMLYHSFTLQKADATQAYADFTSKYPSIAKCCQLQHIASYLGMNSRTLSRIRRKLANR